MRKKLQKTIQTLKGYFEEDFSLKMSKEDKERNLRATEKAQVEFDMKAKKLKKDLAQKEEKISKKLEEKNLELEKEKKRKPFRVGLSFGFFAFLLSPLILFQSILLFLFLISMSGQNQKNDIIKVFSQNTFLALELKLLFYSILLILLFNLAVGILGLLFDRQKLFAIMSLVISTLALVLIFLAPKLLSFQSNVLENFF